MFLMTFITQGFGVIKTLTDTNNIVMTMMMRANTYCAFVTNQTLFQVFFTDIIFLNCTLILGRSVSILKVRKLKCSHVKRLA